MTYLNQKTFQGLFMAATITLTFTSCLGPRMVNKWVAHHYQENPSEAPKKKNDQITIVSKLPGTDDKPSTTEKNVSHLLPLIFYWQFDYRNTCTLNPNLPVNNFTSAVANYSGHGLKQKLNGNRLELTIEQMPQAFVVDDKGHIIWIIYVFGWEKLNVQPQKQEMVVSYRELNPNNEVVKTGKVTVSDVNAEMSLKMFQSLKKLTWRYLDEYDANITAMSKKCMDKVSADL